MAGCNNFCLRYVKTPNSCRLSLYTLPSFHASVALWEENRTYGCQHDAAEFYQWRLVHNHLPLQPGSWQMRKDRDFQHFARVPLFLQPLPRWHRNIYDIGMHVSVSSMRYALRPPISAFESVTTSASTWITGRTFECLNVCVNACLRQLGRSFALSQQS